MILEKEHSEVYLKQKTACCLTFEDAFTVGYREAHAEDREEIRKVLDRAYECQNPFTSKQKIIDEIRHQLLGEEK